MRTHWICCVLNSHRELLLLLVQIKSFFKKCPFRKNIWVYFVCNFCIFNLYLYFFFITLFFLTVYGNTKVSVHLKHRELIVFTYLKQRVLDSLLAPVQVYTYQLSVHELYDYTKQEYLRYINLNNIIINWSSNPFVVHKIIIRGRSCGLSFS